MLAVPLLYCSCHSRFPLSESEQSLLLMNKELQLNLETVQIELASVQAQKRTLEEQHVAIEAGYADYKTHVEDTLQCVQQENESLKVRCSMKEGDLEVCLGV